MANESAKQQRRKLAQNVTVHDGPDGSSVTFKKGTVPPRWAREKILNPDAWEKPKAKAEEDDADDNNDDTGKKDGGGDDNTPPKPPQ